MVSKARSCRLLLCALTLAGSTCANAARPFTVVDSIERVRIGLIHTPLDSLICPGGEKFGLLLRRGDLAANANRMQLLVYRTEDALAHINSGGAPTPTDGGSADAMAAPPVARIEFASTSNRFAITNVRWAESCDALTFIAENPGEFGQVYSWDLRTSSVRKLSEHGTPVLDYHLRGSTLLYYAAAAVDYAALTQRREAGFVAGEETFLELLDPTWRDTTFLTRLDLHVRNLESGKSAVLEKGSEFASSTAIGLSLDGRKAVLLRPAIEPSAEWGRYDHDSLRWLAEALHDSAREGGRPSDLAISQFVLIDTGTGRMTPLLDAPAGNWASAAPQSVYWMADGKSVVVTNTYLPLEGSEAQQAQRRRAPGIAEVDIATGRVRQVGALFEVRDRVPGADSWRVRSIDWLADCEALRVREIRAPGEARESIYRRSGSSWKRAGSCERRGRTKGRELRLELRQSLDTPPDVHGTDASSGRSRRLFELNPAFRDIAFARTERVSWKDADGVEWHGALLMPNDYREGHRIPLVIQVHGFNPSYFIFDGPVEDTTSAYAGQPLAAAGIAVLQMEDHLEPGGYLGSAESHVKAYEAAVELLGKRGLIDQTRVGLIGWSGTTYHVKQALLSRTVPFAAIVASDGPDLGYSAYMLLFNQVGGRYQRVLDKWAGASPLGDGLKLWLERSLPFNVHRMRNTPVRLEAVMGLPALVENWEFYAAMRLQGKPVELLYYPDGSHSLIKPKERLTSQQGSVDWFRYWLNDEIDPEPEKKEQYKRWRAMRERSIHGSSRALDSH